MENKFPNEAELEARLDKALARLPDAPVPSNFTSRVMQAIDLEEAQSQRGWRFRWNWHALLPRAAAVMTVIVLGGVLFHQHEVSSRREAMANSLAFVARQQVPSVEALKNFDAIRRMSQPAHADEDLLALGPELQ